SERCPMPPRTSKLAKYGPIVACLFSTLASAQAPSTPDLLGIYPGMSEQAARTQLQKHSSTVQIQTLPGAQMGFWLNASEGRNPEQITVHVTAPPNNPTVWLVERQQTFERQNPMSQQALLSALRDKYGQETLSQPKGGWLYLFWIFDAHGKLLRTANAALTVCVGSEYISYNAVGLPPRNLTEKENTCYKNFFGVTAMLNRSGGDLLESYDVQLTNLPYAYQAAVNVTNARNAASNHEAKEQLDRGNQNRPTF
ncbi:MAG TPA: hypothetical protein VHB68_10670, partial [Steroidobacteraceae bacterium]|nr:hypothetical protein [Steroidobacteraceae bacterium]